MAGIYIHIPFCRRKCYYCDFYKTVNTSLTHRFIDALKTEIEQRNNYLENELVETIYFGGGTPSVLKRNEIGEIINTLHRHFIISPNVEITFEANPDDLTVEYLNEIYQVGIHRLSIGIQSFQNEILKKMNRRHDANRATEAIENAAKTGFNDISADLIYGLPGLTGNQWKADLQRIFELPVQHLSAYHLTYHEGTAFYTWLKKGTLKELTEAESVSQFQILLEETRKNGFEQYEISNFAKNGKYSKHNSAYWLGVNYIGLGPSAHSFNGNSRRWNVASTEGYIKALESGLTYSEEEILSENNKFNEYVLTRIRTIWGVSADEIKSRFGSGKATWFQNNIEKYVAGNLVKQQKNIYTLTEKGLFVSDDIMTNLMFI